MAYIHYYAGQGDIEGIDGEIASHGIDIINFSENDGETPLMRAVFKGQMESAKCILTLAEQHSIDLLISVFYAQDSAKNNILHALILGLRRKELTPLQKSEFYKIFHMLLQKEVEIRIRFTKQMQGIPELKDTKNSEGKNFVAQIEFCPPEIKRNLLEIIEKLEPTSAASVSRRTVDWSYCSFFKHLANMLLVKHQPKEEEQSLLDKKQQ